MSSLKAAHLLDKHSKFCPCPTDDSVLRPLSSKCSYGQCTDSMGAYYAPLIFDLIPVRFSAWSLLFCLFLRESRSQHLVLQQLLWLPSYPLPKNNKAGQGRAQPGTTRGLLPIVPTAEVKHTCTTDKSSKLLRKYFQA